MSSSYEPEDLALQFLVQEILMDLSRYYERVRQRNLFRKTLDGMKEDVREHVVSNESPASEIRQYEDIFGAVNDQLMSSIHSDTRSLQAYLMVFEEWCQEKLGRDSEELLEEATEEKPQAEQWLKAARENFEKIDDPSPPEDKIKEYQNKLVERWENLLRHFSD